MSNLVTTGMVAAMAQNLARQLGRKVHVHRVESKFQIGHTRKTKTEIRYTIAIEGSHPPMFFGMTINEAKARLAMLSDLLISGVIRSASTDAEALTRADCRGALSGVEAETRGKSEGQVGHSQVYLQRDHQPPDDNDRY